MAYYDSDEEMLKAEEERSDDELLEAEAATFREQTNQRGRFNFELEPVRVRRSGRMGVVERVFHTRLRQTGQFVPQQNLNVALQEGMRRSILNLIDGQNIPEGDRIYVNLASHRMNNNYEYRGFRPENGGTMETGYGHFSTI